MASVDTTTEVRSFTVIHVAAAVAAEPVATSTSSAKASLARPARAFRASKPLLLVLSLALYVAYSIMTGSSLPSTSEPMVWLACLPYTIVMVQKLLKTVHAMESTEASSESSLAGNHDLESQERECEFGSDASHDAIAVVGDVCVYVVVILLLCYAILPWQVRAGEVAL